MAYQSKFKREDIDELFAAILLLETEEDCYRFSRISVLSTKSTLLRRDYRWQNCFQKRKPILRLRKLPRLLRQQSAELTNVFYTGRTDTNMF